MGPFCNRSQYRTERKKDAVHGPALTNQEAVSRVEAHGLDRDQAILRVAAETGIDSERVRWSAQAASPKPTARLPRTNRRRQAALALAAAL
jgi:hypothetical protein